MLENAAAPLIKVASEVPDPGAFIDPAKLLAEKSELHDAALRVRQDEEREWLRAWSFYKGRHWVTWQSDRLVEIEKQQAPKIVLNFILHVVQTRLGHLTKNRPLWTGVPANSDAESRNATRTGVKVLEAYHRKLGVPKKLTRAILWMLVTGKSYLKCGWDPFAGGGWSRQLSTGDALSGMLGDLFIDMVKPHELLPEPGADDLDGTQRVSHRTFEPIGKSLARWPHLKEKIQPIDPATREGAALLKHLAGFESGIPSTAANRVEVSELCYRRNTPRPDGGQFEQGMRAIFVNDVLAEARPLEDGEPEIPFVEFNEIETDGFYPTSTARQLIDINKILDVEYSQQEYNRKVLRPKTLVPIQAAVAKGAFDQTDDEVVEYNHPYEPKPYTPAGIPAHHVEVRNALTNILKELGGNFDILSGKAQSDVRSGRMVSYLQEYAGTVLGVVAQNVEYAYEGLGNMMLPILQTKVREERMIPIVGANRRMEILHFLGANLRGMSAVIVQTGSALPVSRAEKFDRIENWMDKGWLDPQKGLKMLDLADPDNELWADDELDREIASEAIFKLQAITPEMLAQAREVAAQAAMQESAARQMQGLPPRAPNERDILRALEIEAFDFEGHEVIVQELNRSYRKTRAYRERPRGLRVLADAFADWHILLAQGIDPDSPEATAAGQMTRQSAMMGAPGAAGPGAPGGGGPEGLPPADGGPLALKPGGGAPPGGGPPGAGGGGSDPRGVAESGAETAAGLPPVRRPPGPGRPK